MALRITAILMVSIARIAIKLTKHHKIVKRPCYKCDYCGHEIFPTAGTIFHKSATPLKAWLEAMYWMSTTRSGRSAKEIQRNRRYL